MSPFQWEIQCFSHHLWDSREVTFFIITSGCEILLWFQIKFPFCICPLGCCFFSCMVLSCCILPLSSVFPKPHQLKLLCITDFTVIHTGSGGRPRGLEGLCSLILLKHMRENITEFIDTNNRKTY